MDPVIILGWFAVTTGFFVSVTVTAYYVFVRRESGWTVLAKLVTALLIFAVMTVPSGFVAGMILFVGAHTDPVGSVLNKKMMGAGGLFLLFEVLVAWLACSLIAGRLIVPSVGERGSKR